jgi:predicted transcriptional regulator
MTPKENLIGFPTQESVIPDRSFVQRWKHEGLFDNGFLATPVRFLELYAHLKPHLSPGEALFVLELMTFKWTADAPFPSYERIAKRMNITDKMARRYAQSLETKKYLKREKRKGQTNRFDLTGLFDALLKAVERMRQEKATNPQ